MSDYDRLRRNNYHVDALGKARQQEAEEHTPASRGAAEVPPTIRRTSKPALRRTDSRDRLGRTIARPTVPRTSQQVQEPSGGAVVTKHSGLGASLRRGLRERRAAREARRAEERASRGAGRVAPAMAAAPRRTHGCLVAIAVLVAAVVAFYLVIFGPVDHAISFSSDEAQGLSSELSWHLPGTPYYVLALGSDAREDDVVSRTDTMILVRVDPLAGKLTMLSIPRDTKVEIEGHGTQKINAAYAFGGVAGAVRAASDLCDVPISQAVLIKFDGVQELVDYLGGITVNVPVDVYDPEYTGLIMSAGPQEMDGNTALQFSRVRHGFALGDYQRQIDQRLVIEAIMQKTLSRSPLKLPGVVKHMGDMLSTSMRMYSILPLAVRLKLGSPTIYQATVPSTTAMIDGVSYVIADEEALAQTMEVVNRGGDPAELGFTAGW